MTGQATINGTNISAYGALLVKGAYEALPKHQKMPSRSSIKVTYLPMISPKDFQDENEMAKAVQAVVNEELRK